MKLTLQHEDVRSTDALDRLIEDHLLALSELLVIEEARVRLAYRHLESPAFSVHIHLVTPGPDVVLEQRDHTLRAAITKALAGLDRKVDERSTRRTKDFLNNHAQPRRRPSTAAMRH